MTECPFDPSHSSNNPLFQKKSDNTVGISRHKPRSHNIKMLFLNCSIFSLLYIPAFTQHAMLSLWYNQLNKQQILASTFQQLKWSYLRNALSEFTSVVTSTTTFIEIHYISQRYVNIKCKMHLFNTSKYMESLKQRKKLLKLDFSPYNS